MSVFKNLKGALKQQQQQDSAAAAASGPKKLSLFKGASPAGGLKTPLPAPPLSPSPLSPKGGKLPIPGAGGGGAIPKQSGAAAAAALFK